MNHPSYFPYALHLLQELIATESFSKQEAEACAVMEKFLRGHGVPVERVGNNLVAKSKYWHPEKPTLLLNSHLDTVRPVAGWTRDPFAPEVEDGKLYGLGSNDAGGALAALTCTFLHFWEREDLPMNLVLAATAEEEISGKGGIESLVDTLSPIALAVVGEPTSMDVAVAEKGLLVIDAVAHGQAGHAAREEGINALYLAMEDILRLREYPFERISDTLGPVKMSVTMIQAGTQHNLVPDTCTFTIDVRVTDAYTHEEILETLQALCTSELRPRSVRIRPSGIAPDHPFVQLAVAAGCSPYGSPTTSDQALMPWPSVKIGPGDSERSHTADEFIYLHQLDKGIETYIGILEGYFSLDGRYER
jgi:acetylornithine deacetylase